jgi:hypothetical protein
MAAPFEFEAGHAQTRFGTPLSLKSPASFANQNACRRTKLRRKPREIPRPSNPFAAGRVQYSATFSRWTFAVSRKNIALRPNDAGVLSHENRFPEKRAKTRSRFRELRLEERALSSELWAVSYEL